VRSLRIEEAGQRVAAVLEIEPGDPVVALSRVRLADDEAIVTETSYLPADRFAADAHPVHGHPFRLRLSLPPLSAVFLRPER
jgi:DNA-binding GntR family transcriptional regulator